MDQMRESLQKAGFEEARCYELRQQPRHHGAYAAGTRCQRQPGS